MWLFDALTNRYPRGWNAIAHTFESCACESVARGPILWIGATEAVIVVDVEEPENVCEERRSGVWMIFRTVYQLDYHRDGTLMETNEVSRDICAYLGISCGAVAHEEYSTIFASRM